MSKTGRPPKPTEQKRLTGNPGRRPLPEPSSIIEIPRAIGIPTPDRPLLRYGQQLWDRVWEIGAPWISPNTDLELLLMTCEMVDERWNLRVKVMQSDDPKLRRGLRELERLIVNNLSLLGFSPADRSRLGVAEVKAKSKLQEILDRKAK